MYTFDEMKFNSMSNNSYLFGTYLISKDSLFQYFTNKFYIEYFASELYFNENVVSSVKNLSIY
jgi:hypothetical protein